MDFIEFNRVGWNVLTVSTAGVLLLTCLQASALILQYRRIWKHQSSMSVSKIWFLYSFFAHSAMLVYGIKQRSFAIFVAGLLTPFYLSILLGLWKFTKTGKREWVAGILGVVVLGAVSLLPLTATLYYFIAPIGCAAMAAQPIAIMRSGRRGALEIRLVIVNSVANVFWVIYGFALNDELLKIIMPVGIIFFLATVVLWWRASPETIPKKTDNFLKWKFV